MKWKRLELLFWFIVLISLTGILVWLIFGFRNLPVLPSTRNLLKTFPYFIFLLAFLILASIFGAVGSNLSRETIFENYNRSQIFALIEQQPGIHLNNLIKTLRLTNGQVRWHLNCLRKYGLITTQRKDNYVLVFPNNFNLIETIDSDKIIALKSELRFHIHQEIVLSPGTTQSELLTRINISQSTLSYHLAILEQKNLITSEKNGRTRSYYPATPSITSTPD